MARELNTGRRLRRWNSVNDRAVCCQSEGDGHEIAHFDSGGRLYGGSISLPMSPMVPDGSASRMPRTVGAARLAVRREALPPDLVHHPARGVLVPAHLLHAGGPRHPVVAALGGLAEDALPHEHVPGLGEGGGRRTRRIGARVDGLGRAVSAGGLLAEALEEDFADAVPVRRVGPQEDLLALKRPAPLRRMAT